MVDTLRPVGRGARRVISKTSQLLVIEDGPVAIPGYLDFVGRFHISGGGVVARDPRRQTGAGVGAHGQRGAVEGPQGGVAPVKELAPIRGEEGVGDAQLEDGELGTRWMVSPMSKEKLASSPSTRLRLST